MLILFRHGRTEANAAGRLQGLLDLPLDELGCAQVRAAAARVGRPDVLMSSPLLRARQTAEAFGVPYEVDVRWGEASFGEFDGMLMSAIPETTWVEWRRDEHFTPPGGGESLHGVAQRVIAACEELAEIARDRDVVVTTHVTPIKAAMAWALGVPLLMAWRCTLGHASICRISIGPSGPSMSSFNEICS